MIDFLKYKWLYFLISSVVIIAGMFSVIKYGYRFSIDFSGGSVLEYKFKSKINQNKINSVFESEKINFFSITAKENNQYIFKTESFDDKAENRLRKKLEETLKSKIEVLRFETVGPTLGQETRQKTIVASIAAILGIFIYLTFAFSNFRYGLSAILAMIHDFLVVIGSYSLLSYFAGAEVDLLFVTALLTTMSFSVHDTIVVFDKIREHRKANDKSAFSILANKAITETMVRSLNNSLTIILMLTALVLLGGVTIRFFVITLLIGTITGTYSSPFIAVPILEVLEKKKR